MARSIRLVGTLLLLSSIAQGAHAAVIDLAPPVVLGSSRIAANVPMQALDLSSTTASSAPTAG